MVSLTFLRWSFAIVKVDTTLIFIYYYLLNWLPSRIKLLSSDCVDLSFCINLHAACLKSIVRLLAYQLEPWCWIEVFVLLHKMLGSPLLLIWRYLCIFDLASWQVRWLNFKFFVHLMSLINLKQRCVKCLSLREVLGLMMLLKYTHFWATDVLVSRNQQLARHPFCWMWNRCHWIWV